MLGLTLLPRVLKRVNKARWNILARNSPVTYVIAVLLAYGAASSVLHVSLIFAAFLAGFAITHKEPWLFAEPMSVVDKMGFSVFVPLYFAIVGYRLNLSMSFSLKIPAIFLVGSCVLKLISVSLGAHLAGLCGLDKMNPTLATNARGGPGVVLASVTYDAGIINPIF